MGRLYSPKEKRLQRHYIPYNIVASIIALVCIFSLIFTPIVKIDVGKVLGDDRVISTASGMVGEMVGNMFGSNDGSEGEEGGESLIGEIDYMPVINAVMTGVLKNVKGSITISAYSASKVALAPKDKKAKVAMDELVLGDNAIVHKLIDSLADAIPNIFKQKETIQLIEQAMVKTIITSIASELPDEVAEILTVENVTKLTDSIKKLENIPEGQTVEDVADDFVNTISEILGDDFNVETDGEAIRNFIVDNYEETLEYTENFSLEALIAITISKNFDLGSVNEDESKPSTEPETEESSALKRAVADEVDGEEAPDGEGEGEDPDNPSEIDPDNPSGEDPDNPSENDPPAGEEPDDPSEDDPSGGEEPEEPSENDGERVICTTYDELLKQLGFDTGAMSELSANVKAIVEGAVDEYLGEYIKYLEFYQYVFYLMLIFAAPWALMIFFAFLHLFLKNKRVRLWYVKLVGFIPALAWVLPMLAGVILNLVLLFINKGWLSFIPLEIVQFITENIPLIKAVLGGFSSFMWICGVCYLLVWLISIFWGYPISRKIKKARRLAKEENNVK